MKKLIAILAVVAIAGTIAAQNQPAAPVSPAPKQAELKKVHEMWIVRMGKVMNFKDGVLTPLEKQMTMKNGTVVRPNGLLTMKDGSTYQMQDGERLDMEGNLMGHRQPAPPAEHGSQQK